jgi:hypothetical protein
MKLQTNGKTASMHIYKRRSVDYIHVVKDNIKGFCGNPIEEICLDKFKEFSIGSR